MSKHHNPPKVVQDLPRGADFTESRQPQRMIVGEAGQPQIDADLLPPSSQDYMYNPLPPPPRRDELFTLKRTKVVFNFYAIEEEIWDEESDPRKDPPARVRGYKIQIAQRLYLPPETDEVFTFPMTVSPFEDE